MPRHRVPIRARVLGRTLAPDRAFSALPRGWWLIAALLALFAAPVWGQDRDSLRAVYIEIPPYSFTNSNGDASGFAVDVMREVAKRAGFDVSFRSVVNIEQAMNEVSEGRADVFPAMGSTAERREVFDFSGPLITARLSFYARADHAPNIDPDDFTGQRVGLVLGVVSQPMSVMLLGARIRWQQSFQTLIAALSDQELDMGLFVDEAFDSLANRFGGDQRFVKVGSSFRSVPIGIAVDKTRPEVLARLDGALIDLKAEPAYAALKTRWFGPPPSWWTPERIIAAVVLTLIAFALLPLALFARMRAGARRLLMAEGLNRNHLASLHAEALQVKNDQLAAQNEEMERLLHAVSHDLKSPMVTVRGFATLLEEAMEEGDEDMARDACRRILSSTGRLSGITDGLLEFSKVDQRRMTPSDIDLNALVAEATELLNFDIIAAGATVRTPDPLPSLSADRSQLLRLMMNLISNALHHGCPRPGMTVDITARTDPGHVELAIRDNGPGIPEAFHREVFRLFRRLGGGRSDGSGIGLSIVARIAAKHGGTCWASSPEGGGAALHVRLPIRPAAANMTEEIAG
jgi:signal transduction histidine kinase